MDIISPAGGLHYHFKAWRYRSRHWGHFIEVIQENLNPFINSTREHSGPILLIGPSAGYCLPLNLLAQHPILACEPDPVARFSLKRKIPNIQFVSLVAHPTALKQIMQTHQPKAIVFCNFLGQLPFVLPEHQLDTWFQHWCSDFAKVLQNQKWFSFHDIGAQNAKPPESSAYVELPTHQLFTKVPKKLLGHALWQLTPHQTQLIEFLQSPSSA